MAENDPHLPQHVAGIGMVRYPETKFKFQLPSRSENGEIGAVLIYDGTYAGFLQWAMTRLQAESPQWPYRLGVETEFLRLKRELIEEN